MCKFVCCGYPVPVARQHNYYMLYALVDIFRNLQKFKETANAIILGAENSNFTNVQTFAGTTYFRVCL